MHVSLMDGEAYVIADVHLGSPRSNIAELRRCLKSLSPNILIVAGDLFDDEHRHVDLKEFELLMSRFLRSLGVSPRMLIASLSSSSHDPLVGSYMGTVGTTEVRACNCPVRVTGDVRAVVLHGDLVIRNGVLAYMMESVAPGTIGRRARKRLDVGDAWVVYGHSHVPLLDLRLALLNPGPWKVYGIRRKRGFVAFLGPHTARLACP